MTEKLIFDLPKLVLHSAEILERCIYIYPNCTFVKPELTL